MDQLPTVAEQSVIERGCDQLERMIYRGELSAGEKLTEVRTAEMLGLSRPSVREVLARLEAHGLIVGRGRGRSRAVSEKVEQQEPAVMINRLEIRRALLSEAAALAAQHMNLWHVEHMRRLVSGEIEHGGALFYHYLVSHCGNPVLMRVWRELRLTTINVTEATRLKLLDYHQKHNPDWVVESDDCFSDVVEAIVNRDADRARQLMIRYHAMQIDGLRSVLWHPEETPPTDDPDRLAFTGDSVDDAGV